MLKLAVMMYVKWSVTCSDVKTEFFFTTDYRFAETGVLPVIETSLLFGGAGGEHQ